VFLDEPLTNLDNKLQEELRAELKELFSKRGHGAVVFATPQPVEALTLSTWVGFLHHGRLLQYGPTREVYGSPQWKEVGAYFSHPGMNLFPCRRVEQDGQVWLEATPQLRVKADGCREALTGAEYLLGIRAHSLSTQRTGPEDIPIQATVELSEVVGSDTELHLAHQGLSLAALLQGMDKYELGSEVTAYLHPNRFFVFEPDSGKLVGKV
jgi:glycerol transport system ATP-binding protein